MPVRILLADKIETVKVGADAEVQVRAVTGGPIQDAHGEALAAGHRPGSPAYQAAYRRALWGTLIVGWSGFVDTADRPVPFEAPQDFVDRVRAEVEEEGGRKLDEVELRARAQREWISGFFRALPHETVEAVTVAAFRDRSKVEDALGN